MPPASSNDHPILLVYIFTMQVFPLLDRICDFYMNRYMAWWIMPPAASQHEASMSENPRDLSSGKCHLITRKFCSEYLTKCDRTIEFGGGQSLANLDQIPRCQLTCAAVTYDLPKAIIIFVQTL